MLQRALALFGLGGGVEGGTVEEWSPEVLDIAVGGGVAVAASFASGHNRGAGGAVVAAVGGQNLRLAGVLAGHADGVLHGIRATVGEEHVGEITLCLADDFLG